MSQQAGLEEETPRKVWRIVPEKVGKIIDVTGEDDPDAPNNNKDNTWHEPILPT